jgi:hypothetical protein
MQMLRQQEKFEERFGRVFWGQALDTSMFPIPAMAEAAGSDDGTKLGTAAGRAFF